MNDTTPADDFDDDGAVTVAPATGPTHLDAPNRLRLCECNNCGLLYAVPLHHWLTQLSKKAILFCPNGCRVELEKAAEKPTDLVLLNADLVADLAQAKIQIEELRWALATARRTPANPLGRDDLNLRVKFIANRCGVAFGGRRICRFCEATAASNFGLRKHFKAVHLDEIAAMPEEFFQKYYSAK